MPLRIGYIPIEAAAEAYYAKDMGFFSKSGLDADIQALVNAPAVVAALAADALDIAYTDTHTLAISHTHNVPVVVIAPAAEYSYPETASITVLVVPAGSEVRQPRDLNGKVIAVASLRGIQETATRLWIDKGGGDSATVRFVEAPFAMMPAALQSGRVDAAAVAEPFVAAARRVGRVLTDPFEGIARRFLLGAWITTPSWAAAHHEIVRRFAAVIRETAGWANGNRAASAQILAKYSKLEPSAIAEMTRTRFAPALTPALIQPIIDAAARYNGFKAYSARELIFVS